MSNKLPTSITTSDEPSLKEALNSEESVYWKGAIEDEFQTVEDAGTYVDSTVPDKRPIPSGIILKLKRDFRGFTARFKARLVARGNLQYVEDNSYAARYAPVACFDLERILLSLSASFGWIRHQVDVKGAFLYSVLPDTTSIWLKLPNINGIEWANGRVVRLIKSLYGLREAPKLWYATLSKCLQGIGFRRMACSDCLFMIVKGSERVILLAYVDDLALFGNLELIQFVKEKLKKAFNITDLGASQQFLGVTIQEEKDNISLSQIPLIQKLLTATNMTTCKPTRSPLPLSHILYEARKELNTDEFSNMEMVPYRQVLGSLLYLSTQTRPEPATAVSMLEKVASGAAPRHWQAMKHVLRYLRGTQNYGLIMERNNGADLHSCSDADWARDLEKRRSRSGIALTIGGNPIM